MKIEEIKKLKDGYFTPKPSIRVEIGEKGRTVSDDTGTIAFKDWTDTLWRHAGETVEISGMGIKKGEYQGNPQLSMSEKTKLDWIQGGNASSSPAAAPARHSNAVMGVTAGMAINNAVGHLNALISAKVIDGKKMTRDQRKAHIWEFASDLIRISQALEKNKLAPKDEYTGTEETPMDKDKDEDKKEEPEEIEF